MDASDATDVDRTHRPQKIVAAYLSGFLGTAFIAAAVGFVVGVPVLYVDVQRAEAAIVGLDRVRTQSANTPDLPGTISFEEVPVVRFQDGPRQVETRVKNAWNPTGRFSVGQKVTVVYRAGKPEEARIPSNWEFLVVPLCTGCFGVVFATTSAVLFAGSRQKRSGVEPGSHSSAMAPGHIE
jgi:hypothetical protein